MVKEKQASELAFNYASSKKAWMTCSLLRECQNLFSEKFIQKFNRKWLLLIDNCSAHVHDHSSPSLSYVETYFLPPNPTKKLQPLDLSIIAAVKVRYMHFHLDRALDLSDVDVDDIYWVNILTALG